MFNGRKMLTSVAIITALLSNTVFAADSCNVDLSGGMKLDTNSLEFFQAAEKEDTDQKSLYKITGNSKAKKLFINNLQNSQQVTLSKTQQVLLEDYDNSIRQIVPEVKSVAMESVDIAIQGVDLAFNDLLGEKNQLASNLTKELKLVKSQLATNLSIDKGISIGVIGSNNQNLFGDDIEQRVKLAIEKAVLDSMGSILMAVGQQMMLSGDNELSFEERMKNFSDKVEKEIATKTAKIEEKSQVLCQKISKIDTLEEQLKAQIKPLANVNTFTVTQGLSE